MSEFQSQHSYSVRSDRGVRTSRWIRHCPRISLIEKSCPDKEDHPSTPVSLSEHIRRPRKRRECPKKEKNYNENNTFARASRLLVHFFAVTARIQRKHA